MNTVRIILALAALQGWYLRQMDVKNVFLHRDLNMSPPPGILFRLVNLKLHQEEGELLSDPSLYRQLVGSLNYLTITHPDISFAVQQVSQFMQAPRDLHLADVRRIVQYLKCTSKRGFFFPKESSL
ncbi:hypothetical protein F2P56_015864 [Juglans regia]|uniref:Reverse transcriptase Ty1/copia-type domain-containing protein n=1 Tax=Juglans regia TaxID=51240 RepID=A0A833XH17_JUGRE|nr:hypothetical protein F2P56_015864 [Juglans regia]